MEINVTVYDGRVQDVVDIIKVKYISRGKIVSINNITQNNIFIMALPGSYHIMDRLAKEPYVKEVVKVFKQSTDDYVTDDVEPGGEYEAIHNRMPIEGFPMNPQFIYIKKAYFTQIQNHPVFQNYSKDVQDVITGSLFNKNNPYMTMFPNTVTESYHLLPNPGKIWHTIPNTSLPQARPDTISHMQASEDPPVVHDGTLPPVPWPYNVGGCTDSSKPNFNPQATWDDGSCVDNIEGCTDPLATNFNSSATIDDGTCISFIYGCTNPEATNYDPTAQIDNGTCLPEVLGCTNALYVEYNPEANTDDGTCVTRLEIISQIIELTPGWNLVGSYINIQAEPYIGWTISDFVENCIYTTSENYQENDTSNLDPDAITIVKSISQFWSPEFAQFNTLDFTSEGYFFWNDADSIRYFILNGTPVTSTISSTAFAAEPHVVNTVTGLEEGWNIMPVLSYDPVLITDWIDAQTDFDSSNIGVIKDVRGVYWSSVFAQFDTLDPSKAYFIFLKDLPQPTVTANFTVPVVFGCTDPDALNYSSNYQVEDGSCYYPGDISTHIINIFGHDDIGWSQMDIVEVDGEDVEITQPFANQLISTYIDTSAFSVKFIFENFLYDENGVQVPVDNISNYIEQVKDPHGQVYLPLADPDLPQSSTNPYVGSDGIGTWNVGDVLIVRTKEGQDDAFSLRIEGTPVQEFTRLYEPLTSAYRNVIGVVATQSINVTEYFGCENNTCTGTSDNEFNDTTVVQLKDLVYGTNFLPGTGGDFELQPGKGYFIEFTDADASFTVNRAIEFIGTVEEEISVIEVQAGGYIPHSIDIPPGKSHISSPIDMYNHTTNTPYSAHTILYNNLRGPGGIPMSISTISSSIRYIAIPSYSESFDKWVTSSFATPNLDLKWDHANGDGYEIYNESDATLTLRLDNPLIQTSSDDGSGTNHGYTVAHKSHAAAGVSQSLIGAYCLNSASIENYFRPTALNWIHHISGSGNLYWTASGPTAPGPLTHVTQGYAYKITTQYDGQVEPSKLEFGTIPTVVNNPPSETQVLTSDDIYISEPIVSVGNTSTSHEISLVQGWNIFSTYIDINTSLDISPSTGFWAEYAYDNNNAPINVNSLQNYVALMKNNAAYTVWPEFGFNGIGDFDSTQGYQIKAVQDMKLIITGEETDNKTWDLDEGWNIVNWPFIGSHDVLASIDPVYRDKIQLIKDSSGDVYWPEYGFNGIGDFTSGQGYQIRVTEAFSLPLIGPTTDEE
jgi:hypothetical protein